MLLDHHNLLGEAHPRLIELGAYLAAQLDFDLEVVSVRRSNAEQEEIYSLGRTATQAVLNKYHPEETAPGTVRTKARAGGSAHNPDKSDRALAVDFHPIEGGQRIQDDSDSRWDELGVAIATFNAERPGEPIKWGGDPDYAAQMGRADKPHAQLENWKELREQASVGELQQAATEITHPHGGAMVALLALSALAIGAGAYFLLR